MNEDQATALKSALEAGNPDAGTIVTSQPDGVRVTITGPLKAPSLSGPGVITDVELRLRDDGPLMRRYRMIRAAGAARTPQGT